MGYYIRGRQPVNTNRYQIRPPYYKKTPGVIGAEKELVEKQTILLQLEKSLEKMQLELRALELDWLDERVTLDDVLEESMQDSLCHAISVFGK